MVGAVAELAPAGRRLLNPVASLSADGMKVLGEDALVFDGHVKHPIIEGAKFYKRRG